MLGALAAALGAGHSGDIPGGGSSSGGGGGIPFSGRAPSGGFSPAVYGLLPRVPFGRRGRPEDLLVQAQQAGQRPPVEAQRRNPPPIEYRPVPPGPRDPNITGAGGPIDLAPQPPLTPTFPKGGGTFFGRPPPGDGSGGFFGGPPTVPWPGTPSGKGNFNEPPIGLQQRQRIIDGLYIDPPPYGNPLYPEGGPLAGPRGGFYYGDPLDGPGLNMPGPLGKTPPLEPGDGGKGTFNPDGGSYPRGGGDYPGFTDPPGLFSPKGEPRISPPKGTPPDCPTDTPQSPPGNYKNRPQAGPPELPSGPHLEPRYPRGLFPHAPPSGTGPLEPLEPNNYNNTLKGGDYRDRRYVPPGLRWFPPLRPGGAMLRALMGG